jgi:quinol monooxygenase YgiN
VPPTDITLAGLIPVLDELRHRPIVFGRELRLGLGPIGWYPSAVIVRVLTATVSQETSGRVHVLMREQLPLLREYDGLVYVKLARHLDGNQEEIILFEEWRDVASMYAWTGPDLQRPRLLPGAEDLITDLRITHYEALDVDPPE